MWVYVHLQVPRLSLLLYPSEAIPVLGLCGSPRVSPLSLPLIRARSPKLDAHGARRVWGKARCGSGGWRWCGQWGTVGTGETQRAAAGDGAGVVGGGGSTVRARARARVRWGCADSGVGAGTGVSTGTGSGSTTGAGAGVGAWGAEVWISLGAGFLSRARLEGIYQSRIKWHGREGAMRGVCGGVGELLRAHLGDFSGGYCSQLIPNVPIVRKRVVWGKNSRGFNLKFSIPDSDVSKVFSTKDRVHCGVEMSLGIVA
ncbi:hypothetical protein K439DRAFT_1659437 [Ramaria rubella]|nr:hypothetical protein K439DRAFT_1659437 [Ramaria rubella]